MFLIRLAFWIGVAVLLLPTDSQQQARLYTTATHAVERAVTFCDRNARTCTLAGEAWAAFLKKAEFGARLVGEMINASGRQQQTEPAAPERSASSATVEPRGTLSPADMQPPWRAPAPKRAGA